MLSLVLATTRSQSRRLFFFKYFLVRHFRYLLEKGMSEVKAILVFCLSMVNSLPKLLVFPPILMRSWRYFSKSAQFMMPSSTGWVQSMKSLIWFFLPSFFRPLPLPLSCCLPGFLAVVFFCAVTILRGLYSETRISCRSESSNISCGLFLCSNHFKGPLLRDADLL